MIPLKLRDYPEDAIPAVREVLNAGDALRNIGLRDEVHPDSVMVYLYPDVATFSWYARRDTSNDRYGPYATPGGLMGVIDLRRFLLVESIHPAAPTDPALPDDCGPQCPCRGMRTGKHVGGVPRERDGHGQPDLHIGVSN